MGIDAIRKESSKESLQGWSSPLFPSVSSFRFLLKLQDHSPRWIKEAAAAEIAGPGVVGGVATLRRLPDPGVPPSCKRRVGQGGSCAGGRVQAGVMYHQPASLPRRPGKGPEAPWPDVSNNGRAEVPARGTHTRALPTPSQTTEQVGT